MLLFKRCLVISKIAINMVIITITNIARITIPDITPIISPLRGWGLTLPKFGMGDACDGILGVGSA